MEALIRAASDFLAAILSTLGFVGRPRRRAAIRDDLELLDRLRQSADFGSGSQAHGHLVEHITLEVAKFTGVESRQKKPIPWSSVVLALLIGLPLAYWTYKLNQDGFRWISVLPGSVAALMLLATLGMLFSREDAPDAPQSAGEQPAREADDAEGAEAPIGSDEPHGGQ